MTITITPVDEPVSLNGLEVEGGEFVLEEAALRMAPSPQRRLDQEQYLYDPMRQMEYKA